MQSLQFHLHLGIGGKVPQLMHAANVIIRDKLNDPANSFPDLGDQIANRVCVLGRKGVLGE